MPTRGPWTAFFDNGLRGTDAFSPLSYLAKRLGVRGGSITAVPNDGFIGANKTRRYGARILELYEPSDTDFLNCGRSISLSNDGKRWEFCRVGQGTAIEDISFYTAKRVEDRFPLELLEQYANSLDYAAFKLDTYVLTEERPALLIEKSGPIAPSAREFSLKEASRR